MSAAASVASVLRAHSPLPLSEPGGVLMSIDAADSAIGTKEFAMAKFTRRRESWGDAADNLY